MPAPAPCASTQQARAGMGIVSRPETRCWSATSIATSVGTAVVTRRYATFTSFCRLRRFAGRGSPGYSDGQDATETSPT